MAVLKLILLILALAVTVALSIKRTANKYGKKEYSARPVGIGIGAILVVGMIIVISAVGIIPAGHRGVVLKFGAVTGKVLNEGIYIITPIADSVEKISVRIDAYATDADSASKDLQDVKTKVTLNYSMDPRVVAKTYQTLGHEYVNKIIKPAIQEAVKASTAQFDAEKLIIERPKVKEKIENDLKKRLMEHGILVDAVSITDFAFSQEFSAAVEAKVKATQDAQRAENELARVKMEAQQKIENAKAEAESLRIQRQQITPELIELRKIEAQKLAIEKWDGKMPDVVTNDSPVPIMDLFKKKKQ